MRTWAERARFGRPHRSSPAHTTTTSIINLTGRHLPQPATAAWAQPRRRPSLSTIVSRVYPQLPPRYYYHHQQRAPTPAAVGRTPAAAHRSSGSSSSSTMTVTASPAEAASTSAAPGSTPDGPSPPAANQAPRPAPGAPNPPGAAAGHGADHGENAGENGAAAAASAAGGEAGETAAGAGDGRGGGAGDGGDELKTLPAPAEGGNVQTLEVNGKPISLDHLGPTVVHKDGTLSRINNWGEMTEIERQNTLRILVKRNQVRLGALRRDLQADGGETK
ncbi:hypothetical protein Daus18300_012441 [Diaporthe australafricana]|uniref:Uncharacterized protein n=1 Tax=Diaporthe australafricana TaxID=127596 RepID=A0ABR3W2S8_9PEZI